MNDDGHYTMTQKAEKLINAVLDAIVFIEPCFYGYCNLDNFHGYKEYQKFRTQIDNMIRTSSDILQLPNELTWRSIKRAIQKTYKDAIPKVHLYQFLTKTLEYLDIDTAVEGMSKLSPSMTQKLIDGLWGMFGREHPITNYGG